MDPHTPPSSRNGQISPPSSTTPSVQHYGSSSNSARGVSPVSPPASTKPLQQSYTPNTRSVQGFSPLPRAATVNQTQPQMVAARYYDGAQMVTSPTPMPSSPELVPNQQTPQPGDPRYLEWLREKNLKELEREGDEQQKQEQEMRARSQTQTPEQRYPLHQYHSEPQPYSQPQPDLQDQHPLHRRYTEQQPNPYRHSPQPSYSQSQRHPQPPYQTEQQLYLHEQQDPYYQERFHPLAQYHFSRTPSMPLTRIQRSDTGHSSRTTSIDNYASRMPYNNQGFPMHFPSEQSVIYAPRTGHKYGKVTVRDSAKVLMGNGVESGVEGPFHDYGDLEAASLANVHQGDLPTKDVHKFFER